ADESTRNQKGSSGKQSDPAKTSHEPPSKLHSLYPRIQMRWTSGISLSSGDKFAGLERLPGFRGFRAISNDMQDSDLQIAHDRIGPQVRIPVQMGGYAVQTSEMQACGSARQRFDFVVAVQHIEVLPAYGDMLIERRFRDTIGLGAN